MGKHIIIKEARCSFPQVYGPGTMASGEPVSPGITVVLEARKHAGVIAEIKASIKQVINENEALRKSPPVGERLCLRAPNRPELEYFGDNLILKANCKQAPMVLCPDGKTIMTEETNKIYSGCYVNIKIEIWGMANNYGRRVNAKLIAVQYVPKDADSFDGSYVSPEDAVQGFGSLEDDPTGGGFLDDDMLG